MGPYFPQNPWVPYYTFQKSVGSVEPTLTTHLYSGDPCKKGKFILGQCRLCNFWLKTIISTKFRAYLLKSHTYQDK